MKRLPRERAQTFTLLTRIAAISVLEMKTAMD
jgi:hypothetical protein